MPVTTLIEYEAAGPEVRAANGSDDCIASHTAGARAAPA